MRRRRDTAPTVEIPRQTMKEMVEATGGVYVSHGDPRYITPFESFECDTIIEPDEDISDDFVIEETDVGDEGDVFTRFAAKR